MPFSETFQALAELPAELSANLITLALVGLVVRMTWYLMAGRRAAKRTVARWKAMT